MRHRCRRVLWAAVAVVSASFGGPLAAGEPAAGELYVKRDSWAATMLEARAALAAARARAPVALGPWHVTEPLEAAEFATALFPEQGVDLQETGPAGRPRWRSRPQWQDGVVQKLPGSQRCATYLFRSIRSDQPRALEISLGSDDGLAVWFNGRQVLAKDVPRGPAPDQDRVTLDLPAGESQLLLKIFNRGGGHGFYFDAGQSETPELWAQLARDYPLQVARIERHLGKNGLAAWLGASADTALEQKMIAAALQDLESASQVFQGEFEILSREAAAADDPRWLSLYERVCLFAHRLEEARSMNLAALRRAIEDLCATAAERYPRGPEFLQRLERLEQQTAAMDLDAASGEQAAAARVAGLVQEFGQLRAEALLANPLLDFDRLLFVRRKADQLGLPQNWQGNCAVARQGYDNQIMLLSPPRPDGQVRTFYQPEQGGFVGDVELHFDADRLLFSMPGSHGRWQVWEIRSDGSGLRQVTLGEEPDVDNYDACYLPDGRIVFCSTRCFAGVPCVGGGNTVANLFLMDADGGHVRQLCFDQDHNWCPTVLNNGRVLYTRWEYSDSPHYFTRLLFHMNPDGTGQMEYYASNSPWPNSTFYARPIPDHPTKVVAVISGHHGVPRMGELLVFDPALGRREADGVVQRIPGYGQQVLPIITDQLVEGSWPKFLHPLPLSDKYFLVSCKPAPEADWGLYLVDVFDNLVPLAAEPGYAYFEPLPLRALPTPPPIPDRVDPASDQATVYLSDVYRGEGLADVPRGQVKALRLYSPHYAYPGMGGHINIGIDGPWDVRQILGTVPVNEDGSAAFRVPANTPIAVQPLDAQGRALQVMRSWFTAMPGEVLSCVGCHESQNSGPPSEFRLALTRKPVPISRWHGPPRGFSFPREVQPVLDQHCVSCHNGQPYEGRELPDLRAAGSGGWRNFTPSYVALHPFVRRPGPESDYFLQRPLEFHASTSELVQMLEKGHHGVQLDGEGWDRLITWIDLNVPDHGTWQEHCGGRSPWEQRRLEMRTRYANRPENPEEILQGVPYVRSGGPTEPAAPAERIVPAIDCPGWPFDAAEAQRRQADGDSPRLQIELPGGGSLELVRIPAGAFVMGSADGAEDEYPPSRVQIERPFYMAACEITNAQYALFDAVHDSAYISMTNKDHSSRGHAVNQPAQPVVRISWQRAMAFCQWLSDVTGRRFALPSEAQWEWACRAGSSEAFAFGGPQLDFGQFANLADVSLTDFAQRDSPKWHPKDLRFDDRVMITASVGRYQPNAWGLYDMHGNVAEWTRTAYRVYPYEPGDGRDDPYTGGRRVARGGSWYDRPHRARSSFRIPYEPWQAVYNVGFRVILEGE